MAFMPTIVTDFGTMEHTDDIYNCLKNIWAWAQRVLGISIHANPDKSYYRHGNYYFTPPFGNVLQANRVEAATHGNDTRVP